MPDDVMDEIKAAVRAVERGERPPDLGPDYEAELLAAIEELNAKHFVTCIAGQVVVASLEHDETLHHDRLVFSKATDLVLFYKNRKVVVGHKGKTPIAKDLGSAWLEHPLRRTYEKIALLPKGPCPSSTYNLWQGFGVEPKPGEWPLIRQHMLEVICAGHVEQYEWLVRWCAYCVQHPDLRAETAVVLRGEKGAGKGAFASTLMRLFNNHGLQVNNPGHFTGRFNAHLQDVLLLFVDEAFWAGDKAGEGTLKALITEPTITIEPKHVNMFSVPNRLKIIMASNNEWVVPATSGERRFFVLDVSPHRKKDGPYFNALYGAIKGEELSAFLYDLLALDLSDFDHRNPPHTTALNEQKLIGADSFDQFWLDCLTEGVIVGAEDTGDWHDGWPEEIRRERLHAGYVAFAHAHGDRWPLPRALFGKRLRAVLPKGYPRVRQTLDPRPEAEQPRSRHYILPPLEECREAFMRAMNINSHDWPEVQADREDDQEDDF